MRQADMPQRPWRSNPRARKRGGAPRHAERPWRRERSHQDGVILYGWHTVTAALANPARRFRRLLATENAVRRLAEAGLALPITPELVRPEAIAAELTADAVHQGLIAETDPLP